MIVFGGLEAHFQTAVESPLRPFPYNGVVGDLGEPSKSVPVPRARSGVPSSMVKLLIIQSDRVVHVPFAMMCEQNIFVEALVH